MAHRLRHPGPTIPARQAYALQQLQQPNATNWITTANTGLYPGVQWSGAASQAVYSNAASLLK